ncbi:MAG TPA: signal recognition particle-docking protein FtsY [Candidatus Nanoarchaeia archaeon]|nr:signal recognition particle-docking protein FtsY [Candidatus Nanoarchaeia archaeon]
MFKFLKEKISNWIKNISKEKEEKLEVKEGEKIKEAVKKAEKKKAKVSKKPEVEKKLEEPKPEKKGFFQRIAERINRVKISEKDFETYSEELEMLLLENNVALEVAEKIIKELKNKIVGKELPKKEIESEIKDSFKEIIKEILLEPFDLAKKIKEKKDKPYIILFCGVNGTGKTTTIAKIASYLKEKDISCVLAAADTFRAASIEQIKKHGEKVGVKVISHDYGSDPASVAFDAIKYAEKNHIDAVLIDTAGRMHTSKNLMAQIEKIAKVSHADAKIFVGESITGNDAIEQVKSFDWAIKIDGIILTKADIDEKGGTALSVGYVTKKPILYLGTGQEYNKIEPFDKEKFIQKLGLEE